MLSRLLIIVGALATIVGVIFALQGFGVLGGSMMSGSSLWAALGPIIALVGVLASRPGCACAGRPQLRAADCPAAARAGLMRPPGPASPLPGRQRQLQRPVRGRAGQLGPVSERHRLRRRLCRDRAREHGITGGRVHPVGWQLGQD